MKYHINFKHQSDKEMFTFGTDYYSFKKKKLKKSFDVKLHGKDEQTEIYQMNIQFES